MKTGYMMLFQNAHPGLSDAEMVRREMRITEQTEELGFDIIWSAEHHFDHYSILPDNLQALAYLAGRTKKIQLGSAAVILPWNNPLRVAEKVCMLDALCDGQEIAIGGVMHDSLDRGNHTRVRGLPQDSKARFGFAHRKRLLQMHGDG